MFENAASDNIRLHTEKSRIRHLSLSFISKTNAPFDDDIPPGNVYLSYIEVEKIQNDKQTNKKRNIILQFLRM
jgi:hypothetical protein